MTVSVNGTSVNGTAAGTAAPADETGPIRPAVAPPPQRPEPGPEGPGPAPADSRPTPDTQAAAAATPATTYAQVVGWGYVVPEKIVTNHDLANIVDTSDDWIRNNTGIVHRHVVVDDQETSATLGTQAARQALNVARVPPQKVNLIICATSTPTHVFPSTASLIQDSLGAVHAGAYDLSAACSGFVYALSMARAAIVAGDATYVLVVGAEVMSRFVDWTDRATCILFGDGAGAVLVAASDVEGGIGACILGSDGSGGDLLSLPAGGSAHPATLKTVSAGDHFIRMDGPAVFRFATRVMAEATRSVIDRQGWTLDEVDLVIPHQANRRIIQNSVIKQLKLPEEKVFINIAEYGNTSTATIPIALCEALAQGRIQPGQNLVFVGFGGGLSWGACAVKWTVSADDVSKHWWQGARQGAAYRAGAARSLWRRTARRFARSRGP